MSAVVINSLNFEKEVQNSSVPVLLDFWSDNSSYASLSVKTANKMSGALQGRIKVGTVDVNDAPELVQKYKIRAVPTMLLIKNGMVTDTIVGNLEQNQILGIIG